MLVNQAFGDCMGQAGSKAVLMSQTAGSLTEADTGIGFTAWAWECWRMGSRSNMLPRKDRSSAGILIMRLLLLNQAESA